MELSERVKLVSKNPKRTIMLDPVCDPRIDLTLTYIISEGIYHYAFKTPTEFVLTGGASRVVESAEKFLTSISIAKSIA